MAKFKVKRRRPPTVAEFIKLTPLPKEIAHLEPALRRLPNVAMIIDIVAGAAQYDLSNETFDKIVNKTADLYDHKVQRCAFCFTPTEQFHGACVGNPEDPTVVAACIPCWDKINAGESTPSMWRNLRAYTAAEGII